MKNELNASSQRTQTTLKSSTYNVQIGNCTWALAAAAAATAYALLYNVHDAYVSGQKNVGQTFLFKKIFFLALNVCWPNTKRNIL